MECMFEFQNKHGAAYDWSPEEVIYLLSQISNLAASSFVYDADHGIACKLAASGVRLALMAWEAEVDIRLLPHVFGALQEIVEEGARIAGSDEPLSENYQQRLFLVHNILNLRNAIEQEEHSPAPAVAAE